ncbi:hypothetical protein [Tissierella praeacuta]|uniref:hypothetical protein n=1 Tax=Tissierella praeacuta TaxID=43131 RepID=UPI0033425C33
MKNLISSKKLLIVFLFFLIIGLIFIFSSFFISKEIVSSVNRRGYKVMMDAASYFNMIDNIASNFRIGGLVISLIGGLGVIKFIKDI